MIYYICTTYLYLYERCNYGKKTYEEDIIVLALNYLNQCSKSIISYEKILEFDQAINNNLDEINWNCNKKIFMNRQNYHDIYDIFINLDNQENFVLKQLPKTKQLLDDIVRSLPSEIIEVSLNNNALNIIGLEYVDGILRKKGEKILLKNKLKGGN